MKKFLILILGLSLVAASCDFITQPLGLSSGVAGVFKSEDGGESWHARNSVEKNNNLDNVSVNSLVFDAATPQTIYLAASNGIYKSVNSGESWKFILTGIAVADLAADPYSAGRIYAAGVSSGKGTIIKTNDGGNAWIDVYTEPSKSNPVEAIAVSPINPSLVVAGLASGEIIKSTDSGTTWQLVKDIADRIVKIRFSRNETIYVLARQKGLFRSSDGGADWAVTTDILTNTSFFSLSRSLPQVSLFHDLALDLRQPDAVYLGTEQGLFRSADKGMTWSYLNLPVKSSPIKVSAVAVNPANSNNLLVTIFSTVFKSINNGVTWESRQLATSQSGRVILVSSKSLNVIYLGLGDKK